MLHKREYITHRRQYRISSRRDDKHKHHGNHEPQSDKVTRRKAIVARCRENRGITPVFIESICDNAAVLEENYKLKMGNEDYSGMDPEKACVLGHLWGGSSGEVRVSVDERVGQMSPKSKGGSPYMWPKPGSRSSDLAGRQDGRTGGGRGRAGGRPVAAGESASVGGLWRAGGWWAGCWVGGGHSPDGRRTSGWTGGSWAARGEQLGRGRVGGRV